MTNIDAIKIMAKEAQSRFEFWQRFINNTKSQSLAEIGVFRGEFAQALLSSCPSILKYNMIDPWRHINNGYDEMANVQDDLFEEYYQEVLHKTDFAKEKRVVHRRTTQEVVDQIPDESLDFVYIDGDHTLRGITVDMIKWYPKVKPGGYIGGDDFGTTIFQMPLKYEPSLVFPWVVHFAEGVDAQLFALPHWQFLLQKPEGEGKFKFTDLTDGDFIDTSLKSQIVRGPLWYIKKQYLIPLYHKIFRTGKYGY